MPTLSWLTREQDIRAASAAPSRLLEEAGRYGDGNADNMISRRTIWTPSRHFCPITRAK